LTTACRAKRREREARQRIEQDGAICTDRFGQPKVHPPGLIERRPAGIFLGAMAALRLDVEDGKAPKWRHP
jgi:hypothetical protein